MSESAQYVPEHLPEPEILVLKLKNVSQPLPLQDWGFRLKLETKRKSSQIEFAKTGIVFYLVSISNRTRCLKTLWDQTIAVKPHKETLYAQHFSLIYYIQSNFCVSSIFIWNLSRDQWHMSVSIAELKTFNEIWSVFGC